MLLYLCAERLVAHFIRPHSLALCRSAWLPVRRRRYLFGSPEFSGAQCLTHCTATAHFDSYLGLQEKFNYKLDEWG